MTAPLSSSQLWRWRNPGVACGCELCTLVDRIKVLEQALDAEIEQHEAFYIQAGVKSKIQEEGIATAKALLIGNSDGTR